MQLPPNISNIPQYNSPDVTWTRMLRWRRWIRWKRTHFSGDAALSRAEVGPRDNPPPFHPLYLNSVWLYEMHVERGRVGENLATSFNGAEDVGPHFFGQLRDGGLYYFPWLRHFATLGAAGGCVAPVTGLAPRRRSRVSLLTVHPALDSSSAELAIAKHSQVSRQARREGCAAALLQRHFRPSCVISGKKCFRFSK